MKLSSWLTVPPDGSVAISIRLPIVRSPDLYGVQKQLLRVEVDAEQLLHSKSPLVSTRFSSEQRRPANRFWCAILRSLRLRTIALHIPRTASSETLFWPTPVKWPKSDSVPANSTK